MTCTLAGIVAWALTACPAIAGPAIDGGSAQAWQPMTGWVSAMPDTHSVTDDGGDLVFRLSGERAQLPWLLSLQQYPPTGDERYVLLRYKAEGLDTEATNYFLHGQEGTHGGRAYAMAGDVKSDGQWHVLAVDLLPIEPLEPTHGLAIKLVADRHGQARLRVDSIRFTDDLPEGAELANPPTASQATEVTVDWSKVDELQEMEGWTPTPSDEAACTVQGDTITFTSPQPGRGMRWLLALPEPVDLTVNPWISFRYRATGQPDPTTYVLWLGEDPSGSKGSRTIPCFAKDLSMDGVWHEFTTKITERFTVTQLAVGLDSHREDTTLTLARITFSSKPIGRSVSELLPYQVRDEPWPAGKGGFTTLPAADLGGRPSAFLCQRVGVKDWFEKPQISIAGVPFRVTAYPTAVRQTGTAAIEALTLPLPGTASEVYVLTANTAPATEPWGIDWRRPRPLEWLDVPEKVYYEVKYASGPPDRMLPLDAEARRWGMRRGLAVTVVRPDPARKATQLILHDRMQNTAFAVLGATVYAGIPRLKEPGWEGLHHGMTTETALTDLRAVPPAEAGPDGVTAGGLKAVFDTTRGLMWRELTAPSMPQALKCASGPVFRVSVGGSSIADDTWRVDCVQTIQGGRSYQLSNVPARLQATVDCRESGREGLLLGLSLINKSKQMQTVDVQFPVLRGLSLGAAQDTWYLCGKRGGIINRAPMMAREPLGERHPLQMDGFFNPNLGLALACLTYDTEAQHHFINLSKHETGGNWSCEYVQRDLMPEKPWRATDAGLVLRKGSWRAIFTAYTDWLATWFQPPQPRKKWFEEGFALLSANAHYDYSAAPKQRGAIRPLVDRMMRYIGICDWVHLFGWAASKQYGDWGDYDHYDETVGGLEYFRQNIDHLQDQGIEVSLYLDGYLSSAKGRLVGQHAEEWATRKADGSPDYVPTYDAYNQCPYIPQWQEHLASTYARVQRDLSQRILYIDEYGSTDGRWICHAREHGHNGYEIPYAGEVAMLRKIREATGPAVALYTEYPPAEVPRQYIDGSITYQALWSAPQEGLAPHFIDLPRFAFPFFKQFHIMYYVRTYAGNWWLRKFPFFNGEVYRVGEPNLPGMDEPSLKFLRRAITVQCAHRQAFSSDDVTPLVPTMQPGVFANRFATEQEAVYTLYNANGRSVRGPVLRLEHPAGAKYEDAWHGGDLQPNISEGHAEVAVELGPRGIGCIVQKLP